MKKTDLIRIQCFVTKERHEEIEEYAKQLGLSIDQFCRTTMFNRMDQGDSQWFLIPYCQVQYLILGCVRCEDLLQDRFQ